MKILIVTLAASATLIAFAAVAMADVSRPYPRHIRAHNAPSAIAERQRHARTFDPTRYYEHDSRKVPIGTQTWWDLKDGEGSTGRP
jgi:hypothetical protein